MGAAGLGSVLASSQLTAGPNEPNAPKKGEKPDFPQVPKRKLGKLTWPGKDGKELPVEVACLSLGTMFNVAEKQIVLRKTVQFGVTYWDTAHSYSGGNSELGVGKFLLKYPEIRKELFIATKASRTKTIADVERRLQTSFKRMNTNYIDLYYLHDIEGTERLTNELRDWAKSAKERKLIRFFGFTTHRNMAECLEFAAKLDWIDAIMTSYNFRLMQDKRLNAALDACHKAGKGLIAMKTQARGQKIKKSNKLIEHFLKLGFTEGQAKLKVVLDDERFSSACVGRGNIPELYLNVAVTLDKTRLLEADKNLLSKYAQATCSGYCAGCANICGNAVPDMPYVSEVMRYLMYYNSYGEKQNARQLFAQLPGDIKSKLATADYSLAEARCPQRMPIGKLMAEAARKLA